MAQLVVENDVVAPRFESFDRPKVRPPEVRKPAPVIEGHDVDIEAEAFERSDEVPIVIISPARLIDRSENDEREFQSTTFVHEAHAPSFSQSFETTRSGLVGILIDRTRSFAKIVQNRSKLGLSEINPSLSLRIVPR